jgi:hypothetical protein
LGAFITKNALIMTKRVKAPLDKLPLYLNYILLQPALRNRKEYKCVFLNGEFVHEFNASSSVGPAFSLNPSTKDRMHRRLVEFAKNALDRLEKRCPYAALKGLIRVDVMETQQLETFEPSADPEYMCSFNWFMDPTTGRYYRRRLVVNEFEGIQANFKDDAQVYSALGSYFHDVLSLEFEKVIATRVLC